MSKSFRTQYINDPKFQLRYAVMSFTLGLTCFAVSAFVFYLGVVRLIEERASPEQSRALIGEILRPSLILSRTDVIIPLGVLLTFLFFLGIIATHRFAGPLFAIKRHLAWVESGRRSGPIRLRASDELQDLAESLNSFLIFMERKDNEASRSLLQIEEALQQGTTDLALQEVRALKPMFKRE